MDFEATPRNGSGGGATPYTAYYIREIVLLGWPAALPGDKQP